MKLIILIPAYNEEENIEKTILSIPRKIFGIDKVEVLVVNDGSTDKTVDLAMNAGADKIVSHRHNMGVGAAFMTGIRNAIALKPDILVTLDADSQMDSSEIPQLVEPILNEQYDVVIGARFVNGTPKDYPKTKIIGNKIFTSIVSWVTGQKFADTQTGFRAYSKDAIRNISVVNDFTYTQEVLMDLKFKGFRIGDVPVNIKYYRKNSKVVKSIFHYTCRAISIIIRTLVYNRPNFTFGILAGILVFGGIFAKLLTISNVLNINTTLSSGLIILGAVSIMMGVFASVVFRRQAFAERDVRYYLNHSDYYKIGQASFNKEI